MLMGVNLPLTLTAPHINLPLTLMAHKLPLINGN